MCQLRPTSQGWIDIQSPDPKAYPEIHSNYLDTEEDKRCTVEGMKVSRQICLGMETCVDEMKPGNQIQALYS